MANKIFEFIDKHGEYIRPTTMSLLNVINTTILKLPPLRAFRIGKKRVLKDGKIVEVEIEEAPNDKNEEDQKEDESRDLNNRLCGEKVMRLLRDHIIKNNLNIKKCLNINEISSDIFVDREFLKN